MTVATVCDTDMKYAYVPAHFASRILAWVRSRRVRCPGKDPDSDASHGTAFGNSTQLPQKKNFWGHVVFQEIK